MKLTQLHKFLEYLSQQNIVWAPQEINGELVFEPIEKPTDAILTAELPLHPFKKALLPPAEALFSYQKDQIKTEINCPQQVLFGLAVPDLKALTMLNEIFSKDPYYQKRLEKTLIVGHSIIPKEKHQFFIEDFEENILEHLRFDIFIAVADQDYEFFTGSEDGQRVLQDFGYKDYEHIEYAGPIREQGPDAQMLKIKDAFYNSGNEALWEELGKKCIECGKCTIVCPTCFCFDTYAEPGSSPDTGKQCRRWGSCFYTDFSEVAGIEIDKKKPKFLDTTAKRIKFWYEHKFVRIPHEISLPGCVGCGRCTKVCPVGIDIKKNLQRILNSKKI